MHSSVESTTLQLYIYIVNRDYMSSTEVFKHDPWLVREVRATSSVRHKLTFTRISQCLKLELFWALHQ